MAFIPSALSTPLAHTSLKRGAGVCSQAPPRCARLHWVAQAGGPSGSSDKDAQSSSAKQPTPRVSVTNSTPSTGRKLVRNKDPSKPAGAFESTQATPSGTDSAGATEVPPVPEGQAPTYAQVMAARATQKENEKQARAEAKARAQEEKAKAKENEAPLGPSSADSRFSRATKAQGGMTFADAWAAQNKARGGSRFDVWTIIGLLTVLTPIVIIVLALYTGAIPTGSAFE